ncbi:ClpP/crotonase [Hesseltinella vesiculosa]|uniref:3-hydroxyisobutyryl-CoA hydrolase n=1 Tax=Hesseltinella vesiculosa TaxID=101127 RepID=A0A1X2G864_9FUNG|nr:ClpP/crotonase [Hesseltinella vesiculosa]
MLRTIQWTPRLFHTPSYRTMSTLAAQPCRTQCDRIEEGHVLIDSVGATRHITLNRPKAINAIDINMVETYFPFLQAWEKSDEAKLYFLKGVGRGLSSGGDVKAAIGFIQQKDPVIRDILQEQFRMFHFIATLKKPLISLIDGITMGAGAGLSINGAFRIATERSMFAMPETAIGLFPDVSANFYLPRLDGYIGTYLAMTGHTIKGHDVLYSGIATHFVPSDQLPALTEQLQRLDTFDAKAVNESINAFAQAFPLGNNQHHTLRGTIRKTIDSCFRHDTAEEVVEALARDGSAFAMEARATILKRSPTSVKVALENARRGLHMGIKDVLEMEYDLWLKFIEGHDFVEGVTSHVVHKRQPNWQPSTLEQVNKADLLKFYYGEPSEPRLKLVHDASYMTNPNQHHCLPLEKDVLATMTQNPMWTLQQLTDHYQDRQPTKLGVQEKIQEIWQSQS